eukprot:1137578-Pelagomonas_calceolata.AAC.4
MPKWLARSGKQHTSHLHHQHLKLFSPQAGAMKWSTEQCCACRKGWGVGPARVRPRKLHA